MRSGTRPEICLYAAQGPRGKRSSTCWSRPELCQGIIAAANKDAPTLEYRQFPDRPLRKDRKVLPPSLDSSWSHNPKIWKSKRYTQGKCLYQGGSDWLRASERMPRGGAWGIFRYPTLISTHLLVHMITHARKLEKKKEKQKKGKRACLHCKLQYHLSHISWAGTVQGWLGFVKPSVTIRYTCFFLQTLCYCAVPPLSILDFAQVSNVGRDGSGGRGVGSVAEAMAAEMARVEKELSEF